MRLTLATLSLALLAGCASKPLPAVDPQQAWVDMFTYTGQLTMADRLDGKRLRDGRYFQFAPGAHELIMRFDYEVHVGSIMSEPWDRTCYLTVRYDHFQAGQRYRLEGRAIGLQAYAMLYDASGKVVAKERQVNCLP